MANVQTTTEENLSPNRRARGLVAWLGRHGRSILVVSACIVIGLVLARSLGVRLALDDAHRRLDQLTMSLADRVYAQYDAARTVLRAVNRNELPFCSDQQLIELRRLVFETPVVSDIGRLDEGRLICTTGIGRLVRPVDPVVPDHVTAEGLRWYADVDLIISDDIHALVLEHGSANAVIDPRIVFDHQYPGVHHAILAVDPSDGSVLRALGNPLPVDAATAVATYRHGQNPHAIDGYLGAVQCHEASIICVGAIQSTDDVLSTYGTTVLAFTVLGGAAGAGAFAAGRLTLRRQRSLATRLRRAIRQDRLHVEYQPQIDFVDRRVVGVEALVRWTDEEGVRHRPDIFVAAAERAGFVSALTELVIRHAVRDLAELLQARPDLHVAVNFAADDLRDGRLVERLGQAVATAGLPRSQFTIELTERAVGTDPRVKATLTAARAGGHQVAIDDFGVGYSSLGYLQTMPIDYLKIDKSFTDTIGTGSVRATIVPQILDMARTLDLGIVVEGVETEAQIAYLAEHDARVVQGWVYARAMPVDALRHWLADWDTGAPARP